MTTYDDVLALPRRKFGRFGEDLAAAMLQRHAATVVARNVEVGGGELDLIADIGGERAVVEVRSARPTSTEDPELITEKKRSQLYALAAQLQPPVFRVDYVAVIVRRSGVSFRWIRRV